MSGEMNDCAANKWHKLNEIGDVPPYDSPLLVRLQTGIACPTYRTVKYHESGAWLHLNGEPFESHWLITHWARINDAC